MKKSVSVQTSQCSCAAPTCRNRLASGSEHSRSETAIREWLQCREEVDIPDRQRRAGFQGRTWRRWCGRAGLKREVKGDVRCSGCSSNGMLIYRAGGGGVKAG